MATKASARDHRYLSLQAVAGSQRGMFTRVQAAACGLDGDAVDRAVARGRLDEVAPYVYRPLPAAAMTPIETLHAATLSANALAARLSTLALVDLAPFPYTPHLLVVRTRRNLARSNVHSTLCLPDCDRTLVHGIASTTIARATIDASAHLPWTLANRVVTKGIVKRHLRPDDLMGRALALRNPRRPGAYKVISIVRSLNPSLEQARNEWELLVAEKAAQFGLPAPIFNYRVDTPNGPRFLDAAWPPVQRSIEYDGYWEHLTSTRRFDDDRVRQSELQEL
ncbi:MAG TPA: type IV toxin-antitoxin system AbiEi family antitoxin domain-containing protein, partial [Acidimicrobiia bacterium]